MPTTNTISTLQLVARTLRALARIGSIVSILLMAAFLFGGPFKATLIESLAILLFPVGVAVGMVIGWWRDGLGGIITITSLVCFYLLMLMSGGRLPAGPYLALFALPGAIFVLSWLLGRVSRRSQIRGAG